MPDRSDRARSILTSLVAQFIGEEANPTPLITVIRVEASSDFHRATIFVTVYPSNREEEAIHFLTRRGTDLREFLKKNGKFMRIPFFDFKIDFGEKNRQHIDEVAQRIKKEEK